MNFERRLITAVAEKMNIPILKAALGVVIGKVYRATQVDYLPADDVKRLSEAVNTITREWPDSDVFKGRAMSVAESVACSGILSQHKPNDPHQIVTDAENLARYLDRLKG